MKYFKIAAMVSAMAFITPLSTIKAHDAFDHSSPEQLLNAARVKAMQDTALGFLATLTDDQRARVMTSLENNAARTSWSNLPVIMAPRSGMAVTEMTSAQRSALHAMMAAAFSSQGYLKTTTSIWHEDVLRGISANLIAAMPDEDPRKARFKTIIESYDSEKFYVSVFGDPETQNWGWMVTGHHYAANFTIADGKIAFMPLFLGANPQTVPQGRYAGWRILQHEADRALALMKSLGPSQLETAVIADAVDRTVFAGPGNRAGYAAQVGLKASSLEPLQLRLLRDVIDEYIGNASDEAAKRQRKAIEEDGLGNLYFAWWGPTGDPAARYMFRIHGPSILIDYVRESSPDGGFNHVHSIARDPSNDYGSQWLKLHYDEAHQD
ncbi:DUF3500 domain-containing protein [Erythrobacter insulae]|uniref:DUF3500 domain-containing protein n=1 Tax=Erythrobacter insulae TaxID=2584124 RepID=A0A547P999_9SPHN|nr:DUF3500 domain-containing protein [Erythrobacter insulae]TRD10720.1 DUF3500 domain-containing protein [Erythrobacter insulae]